MIALNSRFLLVYFSIAYGSGRHSSILVSIFFSTVSFLLYGVSFLLLGVISGSGAVIPLCLALVLSGTTEVSFLRESVGLA
jgi:lipopolysaccharide export LptBFGC system permease protein LptF